MNHSSNARNRLMGMNHSQPPNLHHLYNSAHLNGRPDYYTASNSSETLISDTDSRGPFYGYQNSLLARISLDISPSGATSFDFRDELGEDVCPRQVEEMHWCTEQDGTDEWFLFKVVDPLKDKRSVWIRLRPYADYGDATYSAVPPALLRSALRVKLFFEDGIEYADVVRSYNKVSTQSRGSTHILTPGRCATMFSEKVSLLVGSGVGTCNPHHLCEIWAALPDCDRRLQAFSWYEVANGSGVEFIVLDVEGSSDFEEIQKWSVRLEREGANDGVWFSRDLNPVLLPESRKMREVVFKNGIPFAQVIKVLRDIPTGHNLYTEDCWYYASTLAHRLTMEVGDDYFECQPEDLCEIWSGERGAKQQVNRVQWFKDRLEEGSEYLILNISNDEQDGHWLWVSLEQQPVSGGSDGKAGITRHRKRLVRPTSVMVADITFTGLRFGQVVQALKQARRRPESASLNGTRPPFKPGMIVEMLTVIQDVDCFWVVGN